MKCSECRELLPALVLGDLSEDQRQQVDEHLKVCSNCRAELENIRRICRVLEDDARDESLSEIEKLRLETAVYKQLAAGESAHRLNRNRLMTIVTRVAAAILLFAIGYTVRALIPDHTPTGTVQHVEQANPSLAEYDYIVSSSMRFSAAGLKVIAHGRKAAIAQLKQVSPTKSKTR